MVDSLAASDENGQAVGADVVAVVLAAGEGRRLRPLTGLRPKPLCPVGDRPLIDRALAQVRRATPTVAVNLHHGRDAIEAHLDEQRPTVHRSIEAVEPLGTAGALGRLRPWIDGRGALVVNADGWSDADLLALTHGWDGERVRVLMVPARDGRPGFGPGVGLVASLLPWAEVARLTPEPAGLYEVMWRRAHDEGRLEAVVHAGRFVDCGRPADYLRANRLAIEEAAESLAGAVAPGSVPAVGYRDGSIVGDGARVEGRVERSVIGAGAHVEGVVRDAVVWPGSHVGADEQLVGAVRAGRLTVEVR